MKMDASLFPKARRKKYEFDDGWLKKTKNVSNLDTPPSKQNKKLVLVYLFIYNTFYFRKRE